MKTNSAPEPLYTFQYPELGYSIQIVPHVSRSTQDQTRSSGATPTVARLLPGRDPFLNGVGRVRVKTWNELPTSSNNPIRNLRAHRIRRGGSGPHLCVRGF
jgi:hypothetical protein